MPDARIAVLLLAAAFAAVPAAAAEPVAPPKKPPAGAAAKPPAKPPAKSAAKAPPEPSPELAPGFESSVVRIVNYAQRGDWFSPWDVTGVRASSGSGFVIQGGVLLTNAHVVSDARLLLLYLHGDPTPHKAVPVILGHDCDLALVRPEEKGLLDKLPALPIDGRPALRSTVETYGYPAGGDQISSTRGVVSRIEMQVYAHSGVDRHITIQTDAAINPGNSGGALVDCSGHLVGVPTAGAIIPGATSPGNIGIGFAIPSDFAKKIGDELIESGRVVHGSFGVRVATTAQGDLFVAGVDPGGPAATAGLRQGDLITEIDGQAAASAQQLQAVTLTKRPGDTVKLTIERDGHEQTVDVVLGSQ